MRRIMLGLAGVAGVAVVAVAGLGWRAAGSGWDPPALPDGVVDVAPDPDRLASSLAALIQLPTMTPVEEGAVDWRDPGVDALGQPVEPAWIRLLREIWLDGLDATVSQVGRGLAIRLDGPSEAPPALWLAHVDVVPVSDPDGWTHPPFAGVVADGVVHGRGALDNKASIAAILEAMRLLQAQGRAPSRDVVLLITPDEEVSGATAQLAASDLSLVGDPAFVLDEGSYLLPDLFEGVLVGAVAVSEKTFVNYRLVARGEDRHSSMPQPPSAVDRLVAGLDRIGTWDTPSALPAPLIEGLRRMAPTRAWPESWVLANADLLEPVVRGIVQASPAGNAITRDTVATTLIDVGVKDNVIPRVAVANVNARLRPQTAPDAFRDAIQARVGPEIEVTVDGEWAQGAPGRWDTPLFAALETVIPAVAPGAVVIPSATPGTMDARYFAAAGLPTHRFHPFVADAALRASLHGTDERIPVEELVRGVRFYHLLLQVQ